MTGLRFDYKDTLIPQLPEPVSKAPRESVSGMLDKLFAASKTNNRGGMATAAASLRDKVMLLDNPVKSKAKGIGERLRIWAHEWCGSAG